MMQKMKEQDQTKSTNIKWHNLTIDREKLEKMRGHKSMVIWFTGLSGSGKSTLANALNEVLHLDGFSTTYWMEIILDTVYVKILGFLMKIDKKI